MSALRPVYSSFSYVVKTDQYFSIINDHYFLIHLFNKYWAPQDTIVVKVQ